MPRSFKHEHFADQIPDRHSVEVYPVSKPTYRLVYNTDGSYDLVEDGIDLFYDKIQSYKDDCDLVFGRFRR